MKFSHRYLEQIRYNPQNAKQIIKESEGGRYSMNRVWFFAARKYHQNDDDEKSACDYFQQSFDNHFVSNRLNEQKKNDLLGKLKNYIRDYSSLDFSFYDYSNRVSIDILHNNIVSGEVFRLDKTIAGGYAITLLDKDNSIWAKELRYPLLQVHYSNVFNCPTELIKIGVYNFEKESHEYQTFDIQTLDQTWKEVLDLSNKINKLVL
jgi:hypothetical protein